MSTDETSSATINTTIDATDIAPAQLLAEVGGLKAQGFRLVTLTSVELDETDMEIVYHFDRDLALKNLRLRVAKGGQLPSISGLFFAAFLVENEIRDQFALTFEGLVLDYQGRLLNETAQTAVSSPFCRYQIQTNKPMPGGTPGDKGAE